jgi:tetratricopeptide (TPR) repeat protein
MKKQKQISSGKPFLPYLFQFPYCCILLFAFVFVLYGQILRFPLGKLDEYNILLVNIDRLSDFGNLKEAMVSGPFFGKGGDFYRPLQNLSFMTDAHFSGTDGWSYYLTHIILHAVICSLIFYLLILMVQNKALAFLLTLLYAAHPLFVHAVAWAPSRGDFLITLFGLISFIFFVLYLRKQNSLYLIIHIIAFFLAVFSKETALVFPVICYSWFFLIRYEEHNPPVRRLIIPTLVYILIIALFLYLRNYTAMVAIPEAQFGLLSFIHNLRAIPELFFKFFIPLGLSPMPGFSGLWTAAGIILFIGMAIFVFYTKTPREFRLVLFGFIWFLLFLIPSLAYSHKFGSAAYDYLEHRAYLPSIGLLIGAYVLLEHHPVLKRIKHLKPYLILLVLVFGIYSFIYSRYFDDPVTYYSLAMEKNPASAIAIYSRGTILMSEKQEYQKAMTDFDQAIRLLPGYPQAYLNRGYCREQLNDPAGAMQDYRMAAHFNPGVYEPHLAIALLAGTNGLWSLAVAEYDTVLQRVPGYSLAWYHRGMVKYQMQDIDGAMKDFDQAILCDERFAEAFANRGILKFQLHDLTGSLADLTRAIELDAALTEAYVNRGRVYFFKQDYPRACQDWVTAKNLGNEEARSLWKSYCRQDAKKSGY